MQENQQAYREEYNTIPILLINADQVKAVQFDVELPLGFTIDVGNDMDMIIGYLMRNFFLFYF